MGTTRQTDINTDMQINRVNRGAVLLKILDTHMWLRPERGPCVDEHTTTVLIVEGGGGS